METRKTFYMRRVVRHWNRLIREAVDMPLQEVLKVRLNLTRNMK